jgi:hypothetical protein
MNELRTLMDDIGDIFREERRYMGKDEEFSHSDEEITIRTLDGLMMTQMSHLSSPFTVNLITRYR